MLACQNHTEEAENPIESRQKKETIPMRTKLVVACFALICIVVLGNESIYAAIGDSARVVVKIPDTIVVKTGAATSVSDQQKNANPTGTNSPLNTLIVIVLGAILGAVGQGIRVVVGLKKVYDQAVKNSQPAKDLLEYRQLALSLLIGFAVGAIAGVLAAVSSVNTQFSKSVIIAFIAAGYAGTDFIEGFMKNNPSVSGNNPPTLANSQGADTPAPAKD